MKTTSGEVVLHPGEISGSGVDEKRRARSRPLRLLVVDPELRNLDVLRDTLPKHNFEVLTCGSGEEALELCRSLQPDAVLAEARLPDLAIEDLLQRLGKEGPQVFLMAREPSAEEVERWMELGAADVMRKPMFVAEIAERIRMGFRREEEPQIPQTEGGRGGAAPPATLVEYVELLAAERRTGTLIVRDPYGRVGYLGLREGNVVYASVDGLHGEKAAYTILGWEAAGWELQTAPPPEENIRISTIGLILESVRWREAKQELLRQLPSPRGPYRLTARFRRLRDGVRLPPDVRRFLGLVEEGKTVPELLAQSPYDERETLDKLVRMVQRRVIEPVGVPSVPRPALRREPVPERPEVEETPAPTAADARRWVLVVGSESAGRSAILRALTRGAVRRRSFPVGDREIPLDVGTWDQTTGVLGIDTAVISDGLIRSFGSKATAGVLLISARERRKWEYASYLYESLLDHTTSGVVVAVTGTEGDDRCLPLVQETISLRPGDPLLFVPHGREEVVRSALEKQLEAQTRSARA
ncbi:MAG: response regulator [candidate division KSB1 bacterium]|nr:response regulator [candidate division KSB1 bacterium]